MIPPAPLVRTAALPKSRFCGIYIPHGATMDKWMPATEGAASNSPRRSSRSRSSAIASPWSATSRTCWPAARARRRRGSRALGGGVPERRASAEGHRPGRQDPRPGAGRQDRPGHAAAVDRGLHRGSGAQLRRRLWLLVLQHHLVEERHAAAADGKQSAGRLRAAVRRRHQCGQRLRASSRTAAFSTR